MSMNLNYSSIHSTILSAIRTGDYKPAILKIVEEVLAHYESIHPEDHQPRKYVDFLKKPDHFYVEHLFQVSGSIKSAKSQVEKETYQIIERVFHVVIYHHRMVEPTWGNFLNEIVQKTSEILDIASNLLPGKSKDQLLAYFKKRSIKCISS